MIGRIFGLSLLLLGSPVAASAVEVGGQVWAVGSTSSTRFPDSDTPGPTFEKDARLVVLVVEAARVRVLGPDNRFGWVALSAVTETEPASPGLEELMRGAGLTPADGAPVSAPPP